MNRSGYIGVYLNGEYFYVNSCIYYEFVIYREDQLYYICKKNIAFW